MTTINLGKIKPLYKGAYGAGITYRPLDFTMYNDRLYVCKAESTGNLPTNTAFFDPVTAAVTAASLGLGNVDNTSDASKPVSTAQQTALNAKAPLVSPAFSGLPTAPTAAAGTNTTQVATTAYALAAAAARYGKNNILGTVSQSAGVPTGAAIERGSNANGEYVRFADGTQICTQTKTVNGVAVGAVAASTFTSAAPFVVQPQIVVSVFADGLTFETAYGSEGYTINGCTTFVKNNGPSGPRNFAVVFMAVGRWY